MRAPPEAENGQTGGGDKRLTQRRTHCARHEFIRHDCHDRRIAGDLAMRDSQRLIETGLGAGVFQAVGVALLVTEAERIDGDLGQFDARIAAGVERPFQAFGDRNLHVESAVRADIEGALQLLYQNHLVAGRAVGPQIVRNVALEQSPDLGADIFGQPAHASTPHKKQNGQSHPHDSRKGRKGALHSFPAALCQVWGRFL